MLQLSDTVPPARCYVCSQEQVEFSLLDAIRGYLFPIKITKTSDMWLPTLFSCFKRPSHCPHVFIPSGCAIIYFSSWVNAGQMEAIQSRRRLGWPQCPLRPSLSALRQCPRREGHHSLNGVPNSPHKGMVGVRPLQGSGNAFGVSRTRRVSSDTQTQ